MINTSRNTTNISIECQDRFLGSNNRMSYSNISARISQLEMQLKREFNIEQDPETWRHYIIAYSLSKNLSDEELQVALMTDLIVLPLPFMDKIIFRNRMLQYEDAIDRHNTRLYDLEREIVMMGIEDPTFVANQLSSNTPNREDFTDFQHPQNTMIFSDTIHSQSNEAFNDIHDNQTKEEEEAKTTEQSSKKRKTKRDEIQQINDNEINAAQLLSKRRKSKRDEIQQIATNIGAIQFQMIDLSSRFLPVNTRFFCMSVGFIFDELFDLYKQRIQLFLNQI